MISLFWAPLNDFKFVKWFVWDKVGGVGNTDKEYVVHGYQSIQRQIYRDMKIKVVG